MLRPVRVVRPPEVFRDFVRSKVIHSTSMLKKVDRLKLWHKENKELFGPLIETTKQKKQRLQRLAKNKRDVHQNKSTSETANLSNSSVRIVNYNTESLSVQPIDLFKRTMFNSRTCLRVGACVPKYYSVRGLKSSAATVGVESSPQGYSTDDKILQIKQRQNDYATQYPSVTLILNKTMTEESKAALEKWKQERIAEMGQEEFNKFYEAQMAVGTKFHHTLKTYFTEPPSHLRVEKEVEGVWNSVGDVLKRISTPKAIESNVVHPVLKYRGIFDAIADFEDKPTLIEWKKSDRPRKSIALTYDNPVQLAAYFGAVCNDLNYKHFNIRDALLVIAYTDGSKADYYHLSTDKLREHWAQWLIRLESFVKKHGMDTEKILKGGKRLFEEDIGNLQ